MADVLNDPLPDFLREGLKQQFSWGRRDCGLMLADWLIVARGMRDPAAHLRGRYNSPESCRMVCGGTPWPIAVARIVRGLGLRRTTDPMSGDIGIVRVQGQMACAIRSGAGWAVLTQTGLAWTSGPIHVALAWRV